MNPFKIVVSFIVVLYLFFLITNILFPAAYPKGEIAKTIEEQIALSKKNLGTYNSKYDIKFTEGINLTKKDFESKDTKIEFECNSYSHCCAENEKCKTKTEWTREYLKFNETTNPVVSTRCENIKGTYFCDVFIGTIPAQVQLIDFSYNNNFYFDSDKFRISAEVTNKGNTIENFAVIETKISVSFNENGTIKEELVKEVSNEKTRIVPKETKTLETEIELDAPGRYFIEMKVTGMAFGFVEKEFIINVLGKPDYDCRIDETRKEIIIDEKTVSPTQIVECDIRNFCSDCMYGFECKQAWKNEFPSKEFEIGTNEFTVERSKGTNCE